MSITVIFDVSKIKKELEADNLDYLLRLTNTVDYSTQNNNFIIRKIMKMRYYTFLLMAITTGITPSFLHSMESITKEQPALQCCCYTKAKNLIHAIANECMTCFNNYVANGANINEVEVRWTPLTRAVHTNNLAFVTFLIEKGANVNLKDASGYSPLHWAAHQGSLEILTLLLEKKAIVDLQSDTHKWSAFHIAQACYTNEEKDTKLKERRELILNKLCEYGASEKLSDEFGKAPKDYINLTSKPFGYSHNQIPYMHQTPSRRTQISNYGYSNNTVVSSNTSILQRAIARGDINAVDENRIPPLHTALHSKALEDAKDLISMNAHLTRKDSTGYTAYELAQHYNLPEIIKLMDSKLKTTQLAQQSITLSYSIQDLKNAIEKGDVSTIKVLISSGKLDINAGDKNGSTGLHYALFNNKLKIAEYLIKQGAKFDIPNHVDQTAYSIAADYKFQKIVELMNSKMNVPQTLPSTIQDLNNNIFQGKLDCVKQFILTSPNDINALDNDGMTPLHWALYSLEHDIAKYLIEQGAQFDVRDPHGQTAYDIALSENLDDILDLMHKILEKK